MYCELWAVTSFTCSLVHFFPHCDMFMLRHKGVLKWNGSFHSGSPFQLSSFFARRKSSPVLTQSSAEHQRWVAEGRESEWQEGIQTRRDGRSIGRATLTNVWQNLTYWMAFLCQDTERAGGREAACFRLRLRPRFTDMVTLSPHASTHLS